MTKRVKPSIPWLFYKGTQKVKAWSFQKGWVQRLILSYNISGNIILTKWRANLLTD